MKKPAAKVPSKKPAKQKTREYTLAQFMKMTLPEASKMVDKKLGNAFTGPFTKHYNQLAATYNVRFPQLQPAFRKLDLLLASDDRALIKAAARMKDLTIQKILEPKTVEDIRASSRAGRGHDGFTLARAGQWINEPDGPWSDDERAGPGSGASSGRASGAPPLMALSHCHEEVRVAHGVWIPELAGVFEKLNRLLAGTTPVSTAARPPEAPPPR